MAAPIGLLIGPLSTAAAVIGKSRTYNQLLEAVRREQKRGGKKAIMAAAGGAAAGGAAGYAAGKEANPFVSGFRYELEKEADKKKLLGPLLAGSMIVGGPMLGMGMKPTKGALQEAGQAQQAAISSRIERDAKLKELHSRPPSPAQARGERAGSTWYAPGSTDDPRFHEQKAKQLEAKSKSLRKWGPQHLIRRLRGR
ncbi:MAG: hypothetical protein GTN93_21530 [Anaerolineae bacterium]|nr:hypothetical protein [Anaerolineae bacterium]